MSTPNTASVATQLSNLQARSQGQNAQSSSSSSALPTKLAKNKRLPATMITPGGSVDIKRKSTKSVGKKQRKRLEEGKEKALERSVKLEEKVKGREDRKAKRKKAKQAWE